jgi:hypothetical protein
MNVSVKIVTETRAFLQSICAHFAAMERNLGRTSFAQAIPDMNLVENFVI